nr:ANTAR domain-containing protein [uncultured Nocardioides sp.]
MTVSLDAMRSELNAVMSGSPSGLSLADALCTTCVGLFGVDGAAVSVVLDGVSTGTFGSSSLSSRRLDEYQFTYGEGPCLEAVASRESVLVPDLDSPTEQRWPAFRGAVLGEGIRGVFAVPIMLTSVCVGALDLFRARPGPLGGNALAGALLAAELAAAPLLDLISEVSDDEQDETSSRTAEETGTLPPEMDRVEVHQATGVLISALDVDAAEALVRLRAHAIATDQTASQVARAIIERRLMLDRDRPDDGGGSEDGRSGS